MVLRKSFLKLINSVYGKTMENLQKKIRLVNKEKDCLKYTKDSKFFDPTNNQSYW